MVAKMAYLARKIAKFFKVKNLFPYRIGYNFVSREKLLGLKI